MLKWIKKRCRRASLPGRAPPSVDDIDNVKRAYGSQNFRDEQDSVHIYETINSMVNPKSPSQVAYAMVSLIKQIHHDDKVGHLNEAGSENKDDLTIKQLRAYRLSQRPLPPPPLPAPPLPTSEIFPCMLCTSHLKKGESCSCYYWSIPCVNNPFNCAKGGQVNIPCPESLIDQHFINRNTSHHTPSRSMCSDINNTIYIPESKCSNNSSGYFSDDDLSQRIDSLGIDKPVLRSSHSHNGFLTMPRMGSKVIKRSHSTMEASPGNTTATPEYLSPLRLSGRAIPTCGVSRSTAKAKLMKLGCKRKHSVGQTEGRHARIRTGLQSYRSLSFNTENDTKQNCSILCESNFSAIPKKTVLRDSQLKKRLQHYKQTRSQDGSKVAQPTNQANRNSELYKHLVKRRLSDDYSQKSEKIFIAYV